MQMQEPEQRQQSRTEWQSSQEYSAYETGYSRAEEPKQQEKIYPQTQQRLQKVLWILTVTLSSIGFFFTVAGIVASSLVLEYANEQRALLAGGIIGLISSIIATLVCILIFVTAVVALAGRRKRKYR